MECEQRSGRQLKSTPNLTRLRHEQSGQKTYPRTLLTIQVNYRSEGQPSIHHVTTI